MTATLVRKLLRDIRVPLLVVMVLLAAFQCLWAKVTARITEEILPTVTKHLPLEVLIDIVFKGPGQIIQTLIGGESINLLHARDVLSIGYVHPLTQIILCIWAVGRAAGAIAGEIDRGTMELLLAQPVSRMRVIAAHLLVDLVAIPLLCLALCAGNWLGVACFGHIDWNAGEASQELRVAPTIFLPALMNAAALVFAVSGYTMWLSSAGRFRGRVLGIAILITLLQFLVNVIGQLWEKVAPLRPLTVFFYYQPQQIILEDRWSVSLGSAWQLGQPLPINVIAVLCAVGCLGYGMAFWTFSERDLPAPL
jgi:ABC-2 type transport system permease protein